MHNHIIKSAIYVIIIFTRIVPMGSPIVIVGPIPKADLKLFRSIAKMSDIAVKVKKSVEELSGDASSIPLAYLSYLPDTEQALADLFARLPLGANEHFLIYQKTEHDNYPAYFDTFAISGAFESPLSTLAVHNMFNTMQFYKKTSTQSKSIIGEVIRYRKQKQQLITISTALSHHLDLGSLLLLILRECCDIVNADAGSIYIRERHGPGGSFTDKLRFKVSLNNSIDFKATEEFTIQIDTKRIASYVAATGMPLNIPDVYAIDPSAPYTYTDDFDRRFNYHVTSMLTVPLKNVEGAVVGVLQVMNKKRDGVGKLSTPAMAIKETLRFSYSDEEFLESVGALAAVSIERAQLHENIEEIFEGFLGSSIAAIDERDRVTSGHSRRVMGYAMAVVEAINKTKEGVFANLRFSRDRKRQFKFAAILHDIGKIGVPETLLNKECRLSPAALATLLARFDTAHFQLLIGSPVEESHWHSPEEVDEDRQFVLAVNKAGYLKEEELERLSRLRKKGLTSIDGTPSPLITDDEWDALSIKRGNLTDQERDIINSHASSSYRILSKIPWTPELKKIPTIAAHHHEKLDGSGYPEGLNNTEMCLEEKILAVVDIYDAIVAHDRPYKPAMPHEKAIAILREEAEAGRLDSDIVEFFVEQGIHDIFD